MEPISLNVFYPLVAGQPKRQRDHIDIDAATEGIQITKQAPGGDASATVGLRVLPDGTRYGWLPQAIDIPELGHVEIRYAGARLWTGRPLVRHIVGYRHRGFDGTGYGFHATQDDFRRFSGDHHMPTTTIIALVARYFPLFSFDFSGLSGAIDRRSIADFDRLNLAEALDILTQQGADETYTGIDFLIRGVGDKLNVTFVNHAHPDEGDYIVDYTEARFPDLSDDSTNVFSMLTTYFDDGVPQEIQVSRQDVEDRIGFHRHLPVQAPSTMMKHSVERWSRTYLNERANSVIVGGAEFRWHEKIQTREASFIEAWQLEPGKWLQIGTIQKRQAYISKVALDPNAGTVGLTLGPLSRQQGAAGMFNRLLDVTDKQTRHIDPVVGGRDTEVLTRAQIEAMIANALREDLV